jgi:hypothetical protein
MPSREGSGDFRSDKWIENEVVGCEFEDVSHGKRLQQLLEQLSGRVGARQRRERVKSKRPGPGRSLNSGHMLSPQNRPWDLDSGFNWGQLASVAMVNI